MRIDKGFDPIAAAALNVCSTNDQKAIWKAGRCLRPRGEWPFSIFTYRHLSNDITIFHGNCHRRAILFYIPSLLQIKPYGLKWYFLTKTVLTYCEKKLFVIEKNI